MFATSRADSRARRSSGVGSIVCDDSIVTPAAHKLERRNIAIVPQTRAVESQKRWRRRADHHSPTGYAPNAATSTGIIGSSACTSNRQRHTHVFSAQPVCANLLPFPSFSFLSNEERRTEEINRRQKNRRDYSISRRYALTIGETIHVMIETIDGATIDSATIGENVLLMSAFRHPHDDHRRTIDAMRCHGPLAEEAASRDRLHT